MELWVYDASFTHIGILDSYDTLIFEYAYADISKLNVFAALTKQNRDLLQMGQYLSKAPTAEIAELELFAIHSVHYKESERKGATIEAKCYSLLFLLKQRVMRQDFAQAMQLSTAFTTLFNHCFRNGLQDTQSLALRLDVSFSESVELADLQGKDCLQVLQAICNLKELGLRVLSNMQEKKHYLQVYAGVDRSIEGEERYVVSDVYDNIFAPEFLQSEEQRKNAAYCINEKKLYSVGTAQGLERREVLLSNNISKTYTNAQGQSVTRSDAELKRLIELELTKGLESYNTQETFKCTVLVQDYDKAYALGDLIRFEHKAWSIVKAMRISTCKESWTSKGQRLELGLGDKQKGLLEKIKLLG